MRLGVSFGALYGPVAEAARLGAEAEAGGFDTLWVPDSPMLYRDPYATLALLARDTRRVRLGTLAPTPLTRHPAVTANAILTIHELSGGRACLGIATGDSAVRRIGARPVRLAGPAPAGGGGPGPPIYVVATGLGAAELAGRVADGVVLNVGVHPAVLGAARERLAAGARAAGREAEASPGGAFFFCALADDPVTARERLKPSVSWFCLRFPRLCETAGLPIDGALQGALARFEADYPR